MNWELHKKQLKAGKTAQFRPRGNSMSPKIESGNLVTVSPIEREPLAEGDIVLCKVGKNHYVHLVVGVARNSGGNFRYQIGNNKGHINGTVGIKSIFGKVTSVEP